MGSKSKNIKNGKNGTNQYSSAEAKLVRNKVQNLESVITRLIERTNSRSRKDIASWRQALQAAENIEQPRRLQLYNLYDELMLDNHITATWGSRKRAVTGKKHRIVSKKDGQPIEEYGDLLNTRWFYRFLDDAMDSIMDGHSLIELQFNGNIVVDCKRVPKRHVVPEFGAFTITQHDTNYITYRDTALMDYLVEVGSNRSLGLLAKAAPNILWKKNSQMAWSEYCEIFGMPLRVGETNTRSAEDMDRMEQNLKKMGSAAYAVMNQGETIKFIESTKGDAFNVYDKNIDRCNSELSKLVLSSTMTTDSGSSRSQSEVHERVVDSVNQDDLMFIKQLVNDSLFPILIKHGYPLQDCQFEWDEVKTITKDEWEIDAGLNDRFEIDIQYYVEKYGVPITGVKNKAVTAPADPTPKSPKKDNKLEAKLRANEILSMHLDIHSLYEDDKCCK